MLRPRASKTTERKQRYSWYGIHQFVNFIEIGCILFILGRGVGGQGGDERPLARAGSGF